MEETGMVAMGPLYLGLHLEVLLMYISGIFYILCAIFIWRTVREERNELGMALFAFLVYQAFAMVFMALEMQTMKMIYSNLASLAVLIGSAYMLKFPVSSFRRSTRRLLFVASLIIVFGVFIWFVQTEEREMMLMNFTLWYDLALNGILVGGSMIVFGFMNSERWLRIKALGGGGGVVSCCVVSNATMLAGAFFVSSVFQFLAPILILGSLFIARKHQNAALAPVTPATPILQ